jgi:hypothetical protein
LGTRTLANLLLGCGILCLTGLQLRLLSVSMLSKMTVRPKASVASPPLMIKLPRMTIKPGNLDKKHL